MRRGRRRNRRNDAPMGIDLGVLIEAPVDSNILYIEAFLPQK
jgi:hypothetical protein